jgi:hypothetical protein
LRGREIESFDPAGGLTRLAPRFVGIDHDHLHRTFRQQADRARDEEVVRTWIIAWIMQSTTSASTIALRMTSSPLCGDDMEPFESTTPAVPLGARCHWMCSSQA